MRNQSYIRSVTDMQAAKQKEFKDRNDRKNKKSKGKQKRSGEINLQGI